MIDARGYSCPMPVVLVQKAVKKGENELTVLVDNQCAADNVTRFAENQGYTVSVAPNGSDFELRIKK